MERFAFEGEGRQELFRPFLGAVALHEIGRAHCCGGYWRAGRGRTPVLLRRKRPPAGRRSGAGRIRAQRPPRGLVEPRLIAAAAGKAARRVWGSGPPRGEARHQGLAGADRRIGLRSIWAAAACARLGPRRPRGMLRRGRCRRGACRRRDLPSRMRRGFAGGPRGPTTSRRQGLRGEIQGRA